MKKAFAALGGAVAAVLIVLVGVGTLYHAPTHDNWDMGTPMLTLAALLPGRPVRARRSGSCWWTWSRRGNGRRRGGSVAAGRCSSS